MKCYLTKSNPKKWRMLDYLRRMQLVTDELPDWWSDVCNDAEPGDTLFIGISGPDAGIYAKATIISTPYSDTPDDEFYVNPKDLVERLGAYIDIDSFRNLVDIPILESKLMEIPALRHVAKWLHVQGSRRKLTDEEGEALNRLI